MDGRFGILAAVVSSALGGTSATVTRFAIAGTDPITLAALRFGIGFIFLLPVAFVSKARWPAGRDRVYVALLGILFFAVFFATFNLALRYTTAARGTLALSALPLLTMVAGALLRVERLTPRKTLGVVIAISGVAVSLATGLSSAPPGAWRGDLIMVAGTSCMALYNVWSRPFIARSSPLAFVTFGMGAGSLSVAVVAWLSGGFAAAENFDTGQWIAVSYLGTFGAAVTFFLWVFALGHATPTQVANTITINPITASLLASILVHEPIGAHLLIGLAAVAIGVWVASTRGRAAFAIPAPPSR